MRRFLRWIESKRFYEDMLRIGLIIVVVILFCVYATMPKTHDEKLKRDAERREANRVEKAPLTDEESFIEFIKYIGRNVLQDIYVDEKHDILYVYVKSNTNSEEALDAGLQFKKMLEGFAPEWDYERKIRIVGQTEEGKDIWMVK